MYPLNVQLPAPLVGFAVANDATEHAALTAAGYLPALESSAPADDGPSDEVDALRDQLTAAGIKYDRRWGAARLREALTA